MVEITDDDEKRAAKHFESLVSVTEARTTTEEEHWQATTTERSNRSRTMMEEMTADSDEKRATKDFEPILASITAEEEEEEEAAEADAADVTATAIASSSSRRMFATGSARVSLRSSSKSFEPSSVDMTSVTADDTADAPVLTEVLTEVRPRSTTYYSSSNSNSVPVVTVPDEVVGAIAVTPPTSSAFSTLTEGGGDNEEENLNEFEFEVGGEVVAIAAEITEDEIARREVEFRDRLLNEVPEAVQVQPSSGGRRRTSSKRNLMICLLITSILVLATAAGAVVAVIRTRHTSKAQLKEQEAVILAQETGQTFEDYLNKAYGPLFSLAQIIRSSPNLWDIADQVGQVGQPNSLPLRQDRLRDDQWPTHRNVTGSACVDEDVYDEYSLIASQLMKNANMDGALVAIELLPMAVLCLAYPLVDQRFDPPLDFRFSLGHDLLSDPGRVAIAEKTVPADGLVTAGPLTLSQCDPQAKCSPILQNTIIARLPIVSDSHRMTVQGQDYNRWGFAVALINWHELVQQSGVFERFDQLGMDFLLSKTDHKCTNADTTGECEVKTTTLAETPHYQTHALTRSGSVVVKLDTTSNDWEMTVVYQEDQSLNYIWIPIVTACVAVAVIACLMTLLRSKKICGGYVNNNNQKKAQAQEEGLP